MLVLLLLIADSPIIITEVMSNVLGSEASCGDRNEYVEIYNNSPDTIDLADFFIYDFDVLADEICSWDNDSILLQYPAVRIHSTLVCPFSYAVILDREYTKDDTTGGNVQPYEFPDSTLILTTDDTTIGDGLANSDPLLLYSIVHACSSSFGTPHDSLDGFPWDPGDGISWERIALELPDSISSWHTCIDSSGGTPGRENSTMTACDLAVHEQSVIFIPAQLNSGENLSMEIYIANYGFVETNNYTVEIFDDADNDSILVLDECIAVLAGETILPFDSTRLSYIYEHPVQGSHMMWFRVVCVEDNHLDNNTVCKEFKVLGEVGELALMPRVFSPNNDGIDDVLQIDYRLPDTGGYLTLAIFDTRGKIIDMIYRRELMVTASGTIFWDGRIDNQPAQTGMYIVYLEYEYHNRCSRAKKTTVLTR
ncbi:MAG: gliding motility-associated C-terminal domain-containing protein [candidate division WOR-3 bacterium]|nr:MAG: gliding motility-associated C-terminal domain-containing protein [candidate division WOR-3 bacterium]